MTIRERDIFQIIKDNPFVSQNEIAERLGLSRSAVSVYLNSMYKKRIIKGRGYIIHEDSYPLLIGPSHIDIRSICDPVAQNGVYTSTDTRIIHGGPTKNAAEYLFRLGMFPKAMFAVASDSFGSAFLMSCKETGIDTDSSIVVDNSSSPVYVEMIDAEQQFIAASFATENLSAYITPTYLSRQQHILEGASPIVLHDSIPPESVEYLSHFKSRSPLILIASETKYISRMTHIFHLFDTIVLSKYLSQELLRSSSGKIPDSDPEDIRVLGLSLLNSGANSFYMLLDACSFCYGNHHNGLSVHTTESTVSSRYSHFRLYNDFRDVFAAVVTYGNRDNLPPEKVLRLLSAARNTLFQSSRSPYSMSLNQLLSDAEAIDETVIHLGLH